MRYDMGIGSYERAPVTNIIRRWRAFQLLKHRAHHPSTEECPLLRDTPY
jgi:hypothetical protein